MIWIYCKTIEDPKEIGDYVCKSNFTQGNSESKSRVLKDTNEDDCWLIEIDQQDETSAIICRIGPEILGIEIEDNCASNVIEPLMIKYGFDNVKWLIIK